MWRETIATRRGHGGAGPRAFAAAVLTGRFAFLLAGLIDLLAVIRWLATRRRSGRLF